MKLKIRWLLYLILVFSLVSSVTLSRYMTTVTGSGTATVAKFAFSGALAGNAMSIDVDGIKPGEIKTTVFTVSNFTDSTVSEVTQNYTVTIDTTGNLPLTYSLKCTTADAGTGIAQTALLNGVPSSAGTLPHTTQTTHTYTLTVLWPTEKNDPKYACEVDAVTLTVHTAQAN